MKRLAITLPQLAARGKQQRSELAGFLDPLDARLDGLARAILNGQAPAGQQRQFIIHDPKRRLITAACFEDRVPHHAVLNLAEPRFERMRVHGSYACRPGKGVHAALAAVQRHLHQAQVWPWFVKVDVDRCFPSIDHALLKALLARRFKGEGFLELLRRIDQALSRQQASPHEVQRVTMRRRDARREQGGGIARFAAGPGSTTPGTPARRSATPSTPATGTPTSGSACA